MGPGHARPESGQAGATAASLVTEQWTAEKGWSYRSAPGTVPPFPRPARGPRMCQAGSESSPGRPGVGVLPLALPVAGVGTALPPGSSPPHEEGRLQS